MITEDQARMIGRAIADAAKLVGVPAENETERRVICLKLAIDTKGSSFSMKDETSATRIAGQVLEVARMYDDFVSGRP